MKVEYQRLSLRPYCGTIYLFRDLAMMRAKYFQLMKCPYPYADEVGGGRYVKVEYKRASETIWLVYGRKPHVIAHEFAHVLLQTFERIGADPNGGNGEPFCYMLSQLMLEAK